MFDGMTTTRKVTVGSRASPLSQVQTEEVLRLIRAAHPDIEISNVPLSTGGDRNKTAPLLSMGRGMFVKEIELALLNGEIDFAIHSAKDLPALLTEGLVIAAFSQRQDPRDVLIDRWGLPFVELPAGARLGTSSPRRTAQLKALRPDIEFLPIRGNVGTRVEKARGKDYDGVVLAAAGLVRLNREGEISEYLSPEICTPDVGQGALAIEARADDEDILRLLTSIDHHPTSTAVRAERAFMKAMGGGCTVPVAAYAQLDGNTLSISAMAARPDGSEIIRFAESYDASNPESAGRHAAESLLERGAASIIGKGEPQ
jgi:hydroxymethylbilane synthase